MNKWGWVFFYNTQSFLESGNTSEALAGNTPLIFNRANGNIVETGTAQPVEHYIEEYELELNAK